MGVCVSPAEIIYVADGADGIYILNSFLVAVLVQSYSASAADGGIRLDWELTETIPVSDLCVLRKDARVVDYVMIDAVIETDGHRYRVLDKSCRPSMSYSYRAVIAGEDGSSLLFEIEDISLVPGRISLDQNYPNPFNPSTTIDYCIPERMRVRLYVYDSAGRLVSKLVDRVERGGHHSATWDGTGSGNEPVSSGIYFYRLEAGKKLASRKMILLR